MILHRLTGRETLELFARLRGMKPQQIADEVNYWLTEVLESPNMLTANVAPTAGGTNEN